MEVRENPGKPQSEKNYGIISKIRTHFSHVNDDQTNAIQTITGPLEIIAGPGSGKTFVLTLRALYILITGKAQPCEIMMTTFTEKAASEVKERISEYASILGK